MLDAYPNAEEIVWVQEEPENMGAWDFVRPLLLEAAGGRRSRRVARPRSASPAEGSAARHAINQQALVDQAYGDAGAPTQPDGPGRDRRPGRTPRSRVQKVRLTDASKYRCARSR